MCIDTLRSFAVFELMHLIGVVKNLFRKDLFLHAKYLGNSNINTFMLPFECFIFFLKKKMQIIDYDIFMNNL